MCATVCVRVCVFVCLRCGALFVNERSNLSSESWLLDFSARTFLSLPLLGTCCSSGGFAVINRSLCARVTLSLSNYS